MQFITRHSVPVCGSDLIAPNCLSFVSMPTLLGNISSSSAAEDEPNSSSHARRSLLLAKILDETLDQPNDVDEGAGSDGASKTWEGGVSESSDGTAVLGDISDLGRPDMAAYSAEDTRLQLDEMDSAITDLETWRKRRAEVPSPDQHPHFYPYASHMRLSITNRPP